MRFDRGVTVAWHACSARAQERQNRLEHEFEADRSRKEQQSEAERRRERREMDDLLRQVRHLEGTAARDRKARADRLRGMRDKRQQRLQEVRRRPGCHHVITCSSRVLLCHVDS